MSLITKSSPSICKDTVRRIIDDNKRRVYDICSAHIQNETEIEESRIEIIGLIATNQMLEVEYLDNDDDV